MNLNKYKNLSYVSKKRKKKMSSPNKNRKHRFEDEIDIVAIQDKKLLKQDNKIEFLKSL